MRVCIISRNRGISGVRKYLLKNKGDREKNLKYDFMPSIIEIVEKPANKWGTVIIVFSLFLFISVFIWAYFARFDIVVSVPGMVNAKNDIVKIEAMAGGQVSEVFVQNGDYVEQGSVILELDTLLVDESMENIRYQMEILNIQKDVYAMLCDGEDITELDSDEYGAHKWIVEALIEEENVYQMAMDEYERQEALGTDVEYIRYEKESYESGRKKEVASALSQCELQLWQYEQELDNYDRNKEFYTVRTEKAGNVENLQVVSEGEVISQGDLLACIVDKDDLIFECYVPDYEIANVEMGQTVHVKLNAYPYNDYGMLEGKVTKISDIAVQNELYGNVYLVDVVLDNLGNLPFSIGMMGSAELVIGKRSVLEYFLEPVKEALNDSFKEK